MSSTPPSPLGWLVLPLALLVGIALLWWLQPGPALAPSTASPPLVTAPAAITAEPRANTSPTEPITAAPRTDATPHAPQLVGRLVQRGQPLPNVLLRLYTNVGYVPTATDSTVTTGADGTFATTGLATPFWFAAEGATVPAEWRSQSFAALTEDHDAGDVEPPLALALDVLVVDATGHPVAAPRCWLARSDVYVGLDPRDARAPRCVTGDANGRVRLDRLHPGRLYLKGDADAFAMTQKELELDEAAAREPLVLTLTRGGRRDGCVFDWRGQPLPGATVRYEARTATTNDAGVFVLQPYGGVEAVQVEAKGHQPSWCGGVGGESNFAHIQLQRAVALRGVVHGGNAATSIVLSPAWEPGSNLPWPGPSEFLQRPLPVAADGSFAIEGLETSGYSVHARAEGLGASASQFVRLREDTTIDLTIEPTALLELRVVDAEGHAVVPIEVVCNFTILEYPSLFGPYGGDVADRIFAEPGRVDVPAIGERVRIAVAHDAPLALGVRSRGFLPVVRVFEAGKAPAELTVELQRAGGLRGSVRGGAGGACARMVVYWPAANDEAVRTRKASPGWIPLDAQGRFHRAVLAPGDYFAAVRRDNRARIGHRADEQIGAIPLVDEHIELRSALGFTIVGGANAEIELHDPPLGRLRGRVLQAGRAVAGAWVVAARPGARLFEQVVGNGEEIDWNDESDLRYVAGQRSGADGSFEFLYCEAGPLELRARHAEGAGTMPPVIVDLPPPGAPVQRDLELALGGIRGRFVAAATKARLGSAREAVLFPLDHADADPFFSTDYVTSVASSCKTCGLGEDGSFAFEHVPDGEWVVRVTNGFHWSFAQRLVVVNGDQVDLGELRASPTTTAKFAWAWRAGTSPRQIQGVWLYEERKGRPAIWAGTFAARNDGAECPPPAGKYLGVVFGAFGEAEQYAFRGSFGGITGTPLSEPFGVELRRDGTTVPATIELLPKPQPQ